MMIVSRNFCRALVIAAALAILASCATAPAPRWEEATDYGVMPPWMKEGEARMKARQVAIKHARDKLLMAIAGDPVDGVTVEQLAQMNRSFASRVFTLIANAKVEEIPDQPKGVVAVKVRVDRNEIDRLAKRFAPKKKPAAAAAETLGSAGIPSQEPVAPQAQPAQTPALGQPAAPTPTPAAGR